MLRKFKNLIKKNFIKFLQQITTKKLVNSSQDHVWHPFFQPLGLVPALKEDLLIKNKNFKILVTQIFNIITDISAYWRVLLIIKVWIISLIFKYLNF